MGRNAWSRGRVLAVCLPAAITLLTLGEALTPQGLDKPLSTTSSALTALSIASAHASRLYVSNLLVIKGLGVFGVWFAAIAMLIRGRGSTFATAAAVIGGVASLFGVVTNVLIGYVLAAASTAHTARGDATQVLVSANTSALWYVFLVTYIGGLLLATILIAIALWRSGIVRRWLPALFVVGIVVGALAPLGFIAIPMMLPLAVAMAPLAVRLWQTTILPTSRSLESRYESR
jgi:hypothetical protein